MYRAMVYHAMKMMEILGSSSFGNTVIITLTNVGRKLNGADHTLGIIPSWLTFLEKRLTPFLNGNIFIDWERRDFFFFLVM